MPWNISGTAKAGDFKFCIRVGHVKYLPCPLNGRGQGHVSNFYILDLVYWCDQQLVDGHFVDYTYDGRARHG